nr:immunoglobulin heavy chain junction region [Mus musculus]
EDSAVYFCARQD